ncbi:hypothetical protein Tco_0384559, partial [Tanacetum coccineum]
GNKDGRRSGKQEDSKALVTIDREGVDWTSHSEEEEDYALMADKNGYTKNHKKTVKNEQARTRESEEYKKKPKNKSRSQKIQALVKSWSTKVNKIHNIPIYPSKFHKNTKIAPHL